MVKTTIALILALLSVPFMLVGILCGFIRQGVVDGIEIHDDFLYYIVGDD